MKPGDLVYYKSPVEMPDRAPMAIVIRMDEEKGVSYIRWVKNNQIDPMPTRFLGVIQTLKSET